MITSAQHAINKTMLTKWQGVCQCPIQVSLGIPGEMTIEKNCMCINHKCKTYCLSCVIVQCKVS